MGAPIGLIAGMGRMPQLLARAARATLALLLSQAGSWLICSMDLNIVYQPFILESILLVLATVALVVTVGLLPSIAILRKKPVVFLREQTQE